MGYDGFCRELTSEQVAAFAGRDPVVRFRMPDGELTFDDLVRGEITFHTDHVPDFAVARANGQPLYTLVNPVDDALMEITHVLRGEDLLSSTPRQLALYDALEQIGVAQGDPALRPPALRDGSGQQEAVQARPRGQPARLPRPRASFPRGCSTTWPCSAGPSAADRDVFTIDEMVTAFDIGDVNPNPARFDLKKAEAINADHMRMLSLDDLTHRVIPFLKEAGVLSDPVNDADAQLLELAMPLVAERMNKLTEAPPMLAFLFVDEAEFRRTDEIDDAGREVVAASHDALATLPEWDTAAIEAALRERLVEGMGLKPRNAFGPVRVAVTGSRVSPPLFESLELLGRERSLARLEAARG